MSTAAEIPAMVTVPSEVVLDTIAALHALFNYHGHLRGIEQGLVESGDADSSWLGEWCANQSSRLQDAAFGEAADSADYDRFPAEIERYVRAGEMTAELLTLHAKDETWELLNRARLDRVHARQIREKGTIEVAYDWHPPREEDSDAS